jgi:molybdopterin-guanine dinucleotide biosynthesis protein MobB
MGDIPVILFIGRSGSGKTTLLERLIPELQRRGHRVAAIKHHHHAGLPFDVPGKDSERLARAGAEHVVVAGPDRLMSVRRLCRPPSLAEVVATIGDVDLILVEGYKGERAPKIQVSRAALGDDALLCPPEELVAVVADHALPASVPQFGLDDVSALADLVEARFLAGRGSQAARAARAAGAGCC